VVHLLGAVLALVRAQPDTRAPLTEALKSKPMEKIHLCHIVFLHHQSVQAHIALEVTIRLD
jgi:hypothetical protein